MQYHKQTVVLFALASFFLAAAPVGQDSRAATLTSNPISIAIQKLQPKLSKIKANKLSRDFAKAAHDCQMPWQILVSIAYNESSIGIHNSNARTHDSGMMMINEKTSLRYALSQDRLLKDEAYSLAAACRVLAENRTKYSKRLPYWIGIYRSGTRLSDSRIRDNAKRYDRMVRTVAAKIGYTENAREF